MDSVELAKIFQQEARISVQDEQTITALKAVKQCLLEIRKCRKRHMQWDEISDKIKLAVKKGYDVEIHLTGNTVRYYYYELARKRTSKLTQAKVSQAKRKTSHSESSKSKQPRNKAPKETPSTSLVSTPAAPVEPVTDSVEAPFTSKSTESHKQAQSKSSDPYERPPESRFTKGYNVKYWKGENS